MRTVSCDLNICNSLLPRSGAQISGGALLPPTEQKLKSKSLPRGLPSDGSAFDQVNILSVFIELFLIKNY